MKINDTFYRILAADIATGNTVFLAGEPGIGKTSIVKSLAKREDSECFIVQVNQLADKADLTGARLVPTQDGKSFEQRFFAHHKVRSAVQHALDNPNGHTYLLLDEINRTTPDVTSGALSISTERELGDQLLPDNIRIVVTGNTKGNVVALDDASLSRFVVYEVEADAQTLIDYLDSRDGGTRPLNPMIKAVLSKFPNTVFEKSVPTSFTTNEDEDGDDTFSADFDALVDAGEQMLQLTTPRTIEGLSDWLDKVSETTPDLLQELLQHSIQIGDKNVTGLHEVLWSHVGNTTFSTHLFDEIVNSISTSFSTSSGVPKPNGYDDFAKCSSYDDLVDIASDFYTEDWEKAIVYALYEPKDNADIIRALLEANENNPLSPNTITSLTSLMANSRLNASNLSAFLASDSKTASQVGKVASLMGIEC